MNLFNGIGISNFFLVNVNSTLNGMAEFINPFGNVFAFFNRNYKSNIEIDSKGQG